MKILKTFLLVVCCLPLKQLNAQGISGTVYEVNSKGIQTTLADANILIMGTATGTVSDTAGRFHLHAASAGDQLIVSYTGYQPDTITIDGNELQIVLDHAVVLNNVEVKGSRADSYISTLGTQKTELITSEELKNNACCNLSESFESNATVDASFTDAVTGARQIMMLGLSGKYAQQLTDLLPTIRGLGVVYGLNFIPGPWIESINLSKGAGSVSNGYESITGQVDVELKKPESSEKLFVNLYANTEERLEANIHSAQKVNDQWSNMFLLHGSMMQQELDHNHDHFLDLPKSRTVALMDRWKYESGKRVESMFGLKYLKDERTGGDTHFDPETDKLTNNAYGIGINTDRAEIFTKTSYGFLGKEYQSLGLQLSGIYHNQEAYYGLRAYSGNEQFFYANLLFLSVIGSTQHKYKTGISYLYDAYDESFGELVMNRKESVPGAFFEYTYDDLNKLSIVAGIRADWYNGETLMVSPRLHAKYKVSPLATVRASVGSGFRSSNIFAENSAYLASSRDWIVNDVLKPEKAWNYGVNFTQQFFVGSREGTLSADLYRTDFTSQVIVDADADPTKLYFYNLTGKSYSNSAQVELSYEWFRGFNTRIAWKLYDVKQTYGDQLLTVPLVPKQRALLFASYKTPDNHWEFTATTQWIGVQRLPDTQSNPEAYRFPEQSPSYFRLLGQATFLIKSWEFYIGGENLTGFVQEDRIIAADDPFGPYFDTSIVWGPLSGATVYGGLRFSIK